MKVKSQVGRRGNPSSPSDHLPGSPACSSGLSSSVLDVMRAVGCGTSIFKFHCGRSQTFFLMFGVCSWLNNVALVSGVQNSESVVCAHVSIPFQITFQYVITKYWVAFSVLCSGSLLFIYFVSSRGYPSVPTLSRMPPLPHLPLREPKVWFWSLWVHFCPVSTFFGIGFH